MKISVLTPSYNYGRYIGQTLTSVTEQGGSPECEHVVVDDASSDDSDAILRSCGNRIIYVHHDSNAGLSATLNHALSLAKGDWIAWLNADDFFMPGAFASVAQAVEADPTADVVFGDTIFINDTSEFIRLAPQHQITGGVLRRYGPVPSPGALFIRRTSLPARGWDTATVKLMDWDLYLQLQADGARFVHVPRPLGAFRVHSAQASCQRTSPAERELVRSRHGLPCGKAQAVLAGHLGAIEHAALKLMNGGYGRQRAAGAFVGVDMRWFDNASSAEMVRRLLAVATRTGYRSPSLALDSETGFAA